MNRDLVPLQKFIARFNILSRLNKLEKRGAKEKRLADVENEADKSIELMRFKFTANGGIQEFYNCQNRFAQSLSRLIPINGETEIYVAARASVADSGDTSRA